MKTILTPLLLLAAMNLAHAGETTNALSAEQARSIWQAMTPDQQTAAKTMMKEQGQAQKIAWGALPDEDKAAKNADVKNTLQPYRASMPVRMASRPYGHR